MLDQLFQRSRPDALARIWLFSDLQQVLPDMAEDCLLRALSDMGELKADLTHLWYLGDAMEGKDPVRVAAMTQMQMEHLSALGLPLTPFPAGPGARPPKDCLPGCCPSRIM